MEPVRVQAMLRSRCGQDHRLSMGGAAGGDQFPHSCNRWATFWSSLHTSTLTRHKNSQSTQSQASILGGVRECVQTGFFSTGRNSLWICSITNFASIQLVRTFSKQAANCRTQRQVFLLEDECIFPDSNVSSDRNTDSAKWPQTHQFLTDSSFRWPARIT